jgi:hypothetical protein
MSNVEVIVNDLLRRIEKLEKSVAELQSKYWELNQRTIMTATIGSNSVRASNAAENESRDYGSK